MKTLLSYWLFFALLAEVAAHTALLVGLARSTPRSSALLALVFPPLAPYYGWARGMRKLSVLWAGALGAYAVGVALANL